MKNNSGSFLNMKKSGSVKKIAGALLDNKKCCLEKSTFFWLIENKIALLYCLEHVTHLCEI